MNRKKIYALSQDIIKGRIPDDETYRDLLMTPDNDAFTMLWGADAIREYYFGRKVHLCVICNGKSGKCSEDCKFCSQSSFSRTDAPVYPLMGKDELKEGGIQASQTPVSRYSIVTTGKRLPRNEVSLIADAVSDFEQNRISLCASLGILDSSDMRVLKDAGITRYHHNLETCESYFNQVCTTHSFEDRVNTIKAARESGLEICAGGIFGIGETDDHIFELASSLKELDVDSVPINFLVPIQGTPFAPLHTLSPLRCLKIIAFFRYFLPDKDILICGGREFNLRELHPMVFYAGASGIMTGNYLTTEGMTLQKDLELIERLGFETREK
jgi:biotin synthase